MWAPTGVGTWSHDRDDEVGGPPPSVTGPLAPGAPTRIATGVTRVVAPNPGMMTGPGTNTYLVGTGGAGQGDVAVVDPGPDRPEHLDALLAAVEADGSQVRWVLVTHTHPDHAPGAASLARRTGAEVLGFGPGPSFTPDRAIGDGFRLAIGSLYLEAVHTPGHAADHLCYLLDLPGAAGGDATASHPRPAGRRLVLAGDHVMEGATVVIAPPGGDMAAYLASLARLQALDPPLDAIAPGHGHLLAGPEEVLAGIVSHRLAREAKVAMSLAAVSQATVDDLLPAVYDDVHEALHPIARYSLWAHLRKLGAEGRAWSDDPDDLQAVWLPAAAG